MSKQEIVELVLDYLPFVLFFFLWLKISNMHKGMMALSAEFGKRSGSVESSVSNLGETAARNNKRLDDLEFQLRVAEKSAETKCAELEEEIKNLERQKANRP